MQNPSDIPRPEYPRPALVRPGFQILNGWWELEFDPDDAGLTEGWESLSQSGKSFERRVVVPYPLESALSQLGGTELPRVVWYRREFEVTDPVAAARTVLHIGACDYETQIWINGRGVGAHRGGYDPIRCEVGHALRSGTNEVVLRVADPDTWTRPRGKQESGAFRSPVDYDRVTGIWQSVWLEPLPEISIARSSPATPWPGTSCACTWCSPSRSRATSSAASRLPARRWRAPAGRRREGPRLPSPSSRPRRGSGAPRIPICTTCAVQLVRDDEVLDETTSPVGLREVSVSGDELLLNGEPRYLRGVLDQGYFPGGWYAAASDADLRRDVELTLAMGFDCARKHQKAEDPRWLHWADRLGLLVWAEMPSGRDFTTELTTDLVTQWMSLVRRDRGHACVVAWVPFNESWGVWRQAERREQRALVEGVVGITRALDPTRPVIGNDGWEFAAGDLYTLHVYEGEGGAETLAERISRLVSDPGGDVLPEGHLLGRRRAALPGADPSALPVLLTECGGVGFVPEGHDRPADVFSYGDLARTPGELEARIRKVAEAVSGARQLRGFVWTQLTDVQQECNGLLTFEREPKLPLETLRGIVRGIGPKPDSC